jgi:hypothetical protein
MHLVPGFGKAAGMHGTGETGANDEDVSHAAGSLPNT